MAQNLANSLSLSLWHLILPNSPNIKKIKMLPTPHLPKTIDYQRVYEPAEDTFLLLDALEQEKDLLMAKKPTILLEIGSGSGCVLTFLAQLLKNEGCNSSLINSIVFIGTDVNEYAANVTLQTARYNHVLPLILYR
jgi:release factor glutamine methyltransferase